MNQDEMHTLAAEKMGRQCTEKLAAYLAHFAGKLPACDLCGNELYRMIGLVEPTLMVYAGEGTQNIPLDRTVPMIVVACRKCCQTRSFVARPILEGTHAE